MFCTRFEWASERCVGSGEAGRLPCSDALYYLWRSKATPLCGKAGKCCSSLLSIHLRCFPVFSTRE